MSRIYDALKQAENPVVQMIEGEQGPASSHPDPLDDLMDLGQEVFERQQPEGSNDFVQGAQPRGESGYRIAKLLVHGRQPVLPFDGSDRRTAECYRILRTTILHHSAQPKVIAISSAGPGDGKTTNAINISGVLALKQDNRVLLIDGDLRQGSIPRILGIDASPGLAEVLTHRCDLNDAIVQTDVLPNLYVLPGGKSMQNPAELLDSDTWREMVLELRERFPFIIVDTTPVDVVADYALIQEVCDGTILVVRPDFTDRRACKKAFQSVEKTKLLGAVLNGAQDWFLWRTRDYYGYYGTSER